MPELHGNLEGLRKSLIAEIQALYDYPIDTDEFMPSELARMLGRYSCAINREISVYISRDGEIADMTIGDTNSVPLSDIRLRRNMHRLSRTRCIHTHPRGSAELSDVDITAIKSLWLDSMCALGVDTHGNITGVQAAFLGERIKGEPQVRVTPILPLGKLPQEGWMEEIAQSDRLVQQGDDPVEEKGPEKALLVSIDSNESLDELAALAESAGAIVVGRSLQHKTKPDPATYIGSGKANELALDAQALEADILIVDDELTGAQTRNLEDITSVRVVDRTMLILDIFAQRASTAEGRLQVSLAQLRYRSGRLIGLGTSLSRLAGGIGTRGPGESKLEIDRRRIREKMTQLRRELDELESQRALRRKSRERNAVPIAALVGYTNTGKSTLLNRLTGSEVFTQDMLFATLDAVSRSVRLPDGGEFILTDTVGFIRKLPTELIDAFHSTLEEAALADVLIIVNDASSPDMSDQHQVVEEVLERLGAVSQPRIDVLNKCDKAEADLYGPLPQAIRISARTGEGLDELLRAIAEALRVRERMIRILVPFDRYAIIGELRQSGRILEESHQDNGTLITAMVEPSVYGKLSARYPDILAGGLS
ncbi:MAG: GTPase HflX [Clostridia bacterium]|nr:GTPase HflX [Clostridia bacterium]